jgi:hypothetical protein
VKFSACFAFGKVLSCAGNGIKLKVPAANGIDAL